MIRAIRDTVVVRERGDLDPSISDMLVMPARKSGPTVEPDHLAYGEIVSIGPGSVEQPCIIALSVGDIVTYDLANVSHAAVVEGKGYMVVPQKALVEANGKVLLDWVITEQDTAAMSKAITSIVLPDTILSDGQRTETATKDGNMRLVYERVVGAGRGRRYHIRKLPENDEKRLAYDDVRAPDTYVVRVSVPDVRPGDLIAFSPSAACRFRRDGKYHRAVPYEEVQFTLDED